MSAYVKTKLVGRLRNGVPPRGGVFLVRVSRELINYGQDCSEEAVVFRIFDVLERDDDGAMWFRARRDKGEAPPRQDETRSIDDAEPCVHGTVQDWGLMTMNGGLSNGPDDSCGVHLPAVRAEMLTLFKAIDEARRMASVALGARWQDEGDYPEEKRRGSYEYMDSGERDD